MRHCVGALLLGLVLAACASRHTVSQSGAGRGGRGGRGHGGDGGAGADPVVDAAADLDAENGGSSGREATGGRSGSSSGGGGMTASCERSNPGSGGRSGSGGVAIRNRGTMGGVGGIKYPCPGDSMLRATPGTIDCGPSDCTSNPMQPANQVGQPYCCAQGEYFCVAGNLAACESGPVYYCDEAADCDEGLHCCTVAGRTMFKCQADCDGRPQLCKTDEECENGDACERYNCGSQLRGLCGTLTSQSSWLCTPLE